ncbi:unnamed protein product [Phytophthora lilii]|uniref:Unnamed protein product n=1 Tax=Phytophthora lilii TaxID=2077276 RepID=A0A9W6XBE0_9STRA|nr:unnamed protein product [Phytophthora lilii]
MMPCCVVQQRAVPYESTGILNNTKRTKHAQQQQKLQHYHQSQLYPRTHFQSSLASLKHTSPLHPHTHIASTTEPRYQQMQILSTLAFLVIAAQCVLASPERKLLRSGYDSPIDFSTLTGGTTSTDETAQQQPNGEHGNNAGLPGIDTLTKGISGIISVQGGKDGLAKLLPSGLPNTDALSSLTKADGLLPTDALSSLTKDGGLDSITSGLTKGGKLPSLPRLPIGTGSTSPLDATKALSGITDSLSGITDSMHQPSTSTSKSTDSGKQAYASEPAGGKSATATSPNTGTQSKAEESPEQKPVV